MSYTEAMDNFIEGQSSALAYLGLNKTAGQIYAYVFIMGKPTSLQNIVDFLCISKGNVSINIRFLEEIGAVKKIWQKGDRKDYYQVSMDIWQLTGSLIHKNASQSIQQTRNSIENTIEMIPKSFSSMSAEERDSSRDFMQNLQNFKGLFAYAEEIGKELKETKNGINLQKLRNIWSVCKMQLGK